MPPWWISQATTPQSPWVEWGHLYPDDPEGYGYQWWLVEPGPGHPYTAEGVFFQFVYVSPKYNIVIVKASAYDDFWSVPLMIEQFTAFDAIGRAFENNS